MGLAIIGIYVDWDGVSITEKQRINFYKKNITFNLVDPVGAVIEEWELKGAFIQSANFGDLDFSVSDPVEISLTLKYDYAVLKF